MDADSPFAHLGPPPKPLISCRTIHILFCLSCNHVWKAPTMQRCPGCPEGSVKLLYVYTCDAPRG